MQFIGRGIEDGNHKGGIEGYDPSYAKRVVYRPKYCGVQYAVFDDVECFKEEKIYQSLIGYGYAFSAG